MSEEYREYFKDPRWQKLRLKILERDGFACQSCFDTESTLHVHHRYYKKGKKPWEYEESALVTLCEDCHQEETAEIKEACNVLEESFKARFFANDIIKIASIFRKCNFFVADEVVPAVLEYWLLNEKNIRFLSDKYFKSIKTKKRRKK